MSETADWLAYRGSKADSALYVRALDGSKSVSFATVTDFGFAKKGNVLFYTSAGSDKQEKKETAGLFAAPENGSTLLYEGKGIFKNVSFDERR